MMIEIHKFSLINYVNNSSFKYARLSKLRLPSQRIYYSYMVNSI